MAQIDTPEAPISVIQKMEIELIDGTVFDINVQDLLEDGYNEQELEELINVRLEANEHIIEDVSLFINAEHVANTVQPITNSILKNL